MGFEKMLPVDKSRKTKIPFESEEPIVPDPEPPPKEEKIMQDVRIKIPTKNKKIIV